MLFSSIGICSRDNSSLVSSSAITLISIPVPGKTVSSIVTVLYIGSAIPMQSNPGPKLAVVAGTFTLTFIFPLFLYFSK